MSWNPAYIILIIVSTLIDYLCGKKMVTFETKEDRKPYLYISLFSNLGILFSFKYYNFFIDSFSVLLDGLNLDYAIPSLNVLLPVGISFYTFQTMSYSIDVYYGRIKPEKHLGIFAVFVSFFPQLVAGPIERAGNLLSQFHKESSFDFNRTKSGLLLIGWGLFKKVVIADHIGILVDVVYNNPEGLSGLLLFGSTVLFAFQIYCDFSGYSDIAIGSSLILGITLMENFRRPYFSKSISEFWRRWHISLSTWFKDYVYIPLGGNRVVKWRWYYNLFITFLISGLWHGANWTFVVWGALHGFYLIAEQLLGPYTGKIKFRNTFFNKLLRVSVVFSLVCFAWIFFRANTIQDAFYISGHLFQDWTLDFRALKDSLDLTNELNGRLYSQLYILPISIICIGIMELIHYQQRKKSLRQQLKKAPLLLQWSLYSLLILSIILFSNSDYFQFIYFQF